MITTIIFDFDGTIADTFPLGIELVHRYGKEYGVRDITDTDIEKYRSLPIRSILKDFGIPLRQLPSLAIEVKSKMKERIHEALPFPGIPEVLQKLSQSYKLYILTSNSVENVEIFLKKYDLLHFFENVDSELNLFGKHRGLRKMIKRFNLKKDELAYIGDEVRDIEACKKANIPIISVTWGFNSKKFLEENNPDNIADSPEEILLEVERIKLSKGIYE